jgi:hypothetical protein
VYTFVPLALRVRPLLLPFAVFCCAELIGLFAAYYSPRFPLNVLLGPLIRSAWGESFLHYPDNFLLLPRLAAISRSLLYILLGSLLNGTAFLIAADVYKNREVSFRDSFSRAVRRYPGLLCLSLAVMFTVSAAALAVKYLLVSYFPGYAVQAARFWSGPGMVIVNFMAGTALQACLMFSFPALLFEEKNVFRSLLRSLVIFRKVPAATLALFAIPAAVYLPVTALLYKTPFLVSVNPESVLYISAAGALINSLLIDFLVIVSITCMYFKVTNE